MKYSNFLPFDLIRLVLPIGAVPYTTRLTVLRDYLAGTSPDPGIDLALDAAIQWICDAQDNTSTPDRGISRHFSLIDGWGPSYPETTGYIVPTIIEYSRLTHDPRLIERSVQMLDWLLSIQNEDGSFNGGTITSTPQTPVLFNTGQILIGLAAGTRDVSDKYEEPMMRAADWMMAAQDDDGCWRRFPSPFAGPGLRTYDTHAAIGLFETASVCGKSKYSDAAQKNIDWTISEQRPNGWFENCCITDVDKPLTHAIGYTVRGLLAAYRFSHDPRYLDAARLTLDSLLGCLKENRTLPGRLDANWSSRARWTCMTGNLQIAECWLILYEETGEAAYLDAARRINEFARCIMRLHGPRERNGAIPGAYPISGEYTPYQYPNWATKFFVDSNLAEQRVLVGTE